MLGRVEVSVDEAGKVNGGWGREGLAWGVCPVAFGREDG